MQISSFFSTLLFYSLLFSYVHHARCSWAGNARQTIKFKPFSDLCRAELQIRMIFFPSELFEEGILPHTRNVRDCRAAHKTKQRSERRQQNVLQNVELTFNEIQFARFLLFFYKYIFFFFAFSICYID